MGTDSLMSLSDLRGEKESKYLKTYYEQTVLKESGL